MPPRRFYRVGAQKPKWFAVKNARKLQAWLYINMSIMVVWWYMCYIHWRGRWSINWLALPLAGNSPTMRAKRHDKLSPDTVAVVYKRIFRHWPITSDVQDGRYNVTYCRRKV